jgi:hypothetical protein
MKILSEVIALGKAPSPQVVGRTCLQVREGLILTEYFADRKDARLCIDGRLVLPEDPYFARGDESVECLSDKGEFEYYLGIIEALDVELDALREAGYTIRDLRLVGLAEFLELNFSR